MCSNGGELNLDEVLWVPGVDYAGGWRDAKNACDELMAALAAACPEAEGVTAVAQSAPDGSGVIQLRIPPATAQALAELLRAATPGRNGHRAAS